MLIRKKVLGLLLCQARSKHFQDLKQSRNTPNKTDLNELMDKTLGLLYKYPYCAIYSDLSTMKHQHRKNTPMAHVHVLKKKKKKENWQNDKTEGNFYGDPLILCTSVAMSVVERVYSLRLSPWNWCGIALIAKPSKCVNRGRVCRARQSGQNGIKPTTFSFNCMPGRWSNSDWIEVKWAVLNSSKFNTLKHWMTYLSK